MMNLLSSLLATLLLLANPALAAESVPSGMMEECGMMGDGFMMLVVMALLVLLFITLTLAILALAKYLFFSKSKTGDRS